MTGSAARPGPGADPVRLDLPAAMSRAFELAAAAPDPRPNPRVGCVLLAADGTVIGEGGHAGPPSPHAEVLALRAAGDRARGATAVVSLEPCDHTGRTGPCTEALIGAGVARVVAAQADPNPAAAGGADRLRAAGIDVTMGLLADEAEALNPAWTFAMRQQRPWVVWKNAATLDGFVAAGDGTSRWITGDAARAEVHRLRAEVDAVVVGTGTVLTDDPQLSVRGEPAGAQPPGPWRVVMGQRAIPANARVRLAEPVARFWHLPTRDPRFAVTQLFRRGVHHVLLEGGPTLAAAFLRAGLIDEIRWYTAPALLGAGRNAVADLHIRSLAEIRRYRLIGVSQVGDDVRIDLRP